MKYEFNRAAVEAFVGHYLTMPCADKSIFFELAVSGNSATNNGPSERALQEIGLLNEGGQVNEDLRQVVDFAFDVNPEQVNDMPLAGCPVPDIPRFQALQAALADSEQSSDTIEAVLG